MNKRLSLFALSAVLICLVGALPARAALITSSVSFNEACPVCSLNGGGTAVDMMEVFIQPVAGVTFQSPGLNVYDAGWGNPGWLENDVNPMYSNASGTAMSAFNYILNFNIDGTMYPSTVAFNVDVYYFQNGTPIDAAVLTYNGASDFQTVVNNWGVIALADTNGLAGENTTPVPEPVSLLLLGTGLGGLALAAWRRKKA